MKETDDFWYKRYKREVKKLVKIIKAECDWMGIEYKDYKRLNSYASKRYEALLKSLDEI